jgi:predicted esterase
MLSKWTVIEPVSGTKPVGCMLALPGRGIPTSYMESIFEHSGLWRSMAVILEPNNLEWYPQPNGIHDQNDAVEGLPAARAVIEKAISTIQNGWGFKRNEIGIMGFSAGGVMTINVMAHSVEPLAGGVCLAGAILNPKQLPKCPTGAPLIVQHNMDDNCFKWDERYVPMQKALQKQKYPVDFVERYHGGHQVSHLDVRLLRDFFSKRFGYYDDYEVIENENVGEDMY